MKSFARTALVGAFLLAWPDAAVACPGCIEGSDPGLYTGFLWGMGLMSLAKAIVVVDHFVDVQDLSEVTWRVTNNLDAGQDILFASGPVDDLDHASPTPRFGSKVGIDATAKGPMEGRQREWPPDIVMSPEVKALVDGKWAEYGL